MLDFIIFLAIICAPFGLAAAFVGIVNYITGENF